MENDELKKQLEERKYDFIPMFLEYRDKHDDRLWLTNVLNKWCQEDIPFVFDDEEDERTAWRIFFRLEEEVLKYVVSSFEEHGDEPHQGVVQRLKYLTRRKGGRPKLKSEKESRHYKSLVIKMNENEYKEFEESFAKSGEKEKKYFVLSCTQRVDEWTQWRTQSQESFDLIIELNGLLRSIGNNINQVAKQVNTKGNCTHEDVANLQVMMLQVNKAVADSLDAMDNLIARRRRKKRK